jgi:predicted lipoprotein
MKKLLVALIASASLFAVSAAPAQAIDGVVRIPEYSTISQTQQVLAQRRAQYPNWRLQVDMGTNESTYTRWERCVYSYLGVGLLSTNQYVCNRAWGSP